MGQINKHREGLQRERDKLLNEVALLTEKIEEAAQDQEAVEKKHAEALKKISELTKTIDVTYYTISKLLLITNHF